jgi:hypothetical protein
MSFLKRREPERGVNQLPKQATPPTLKQLQGMWQETTQLNGRTCQITFGDPPEEYSLAVFRDRQKGDVHWALYRGEGESSMMVWDQPSNDPGFIHQLITAQFPGFDLKPVALRPTGAFQLPHQSDSLNQSAPATQTYEQQSTTGRLRGKPTFEGDLKNIQMPNVLQSIAMSKGSGRLEVENVNESATIFFADGMPVHCFNRGFEGESAFVELVGWEEGEFRFYPGPHHDQVTIKRRLDTLLMEGSALDDQYKALKKWGANDSAFLWRTNAAISEKEFFDVLKKGTGASPTGCRQFYERIDDRTRLIDVVRRCNLIKAQWVPLVFNLSTCNLIAFNDQLPDSTSKFVSDANIDWSQAETVERLLIRSDTLLYSYPTFLYLLKNEFTRWERFGRPFSVVLLQLSAASEPQGAPEPLPILAVREISDRVNRLKRKTDFFAHYETFGFAFLLLETSAQEGQAFTNRLIEALTKNPLSGGLSGISVLAKAGVACIPDDCSTLGSVLARARPGSQ